MIPPGTIGLAYRYASAGAHALGDNVTVSHDAVAAQVMLPALLARRLGLAEWERPSPPRAVGRGFVAADLTPEDEDAFARLRAVVAPGASSEEVAERAQEWRLPVLPYRPRPAFAGAARVVHGLRAAGSGRIDGAVVADLTAVWAGPLATWLLATCGARVLKIEPDVRLDGTRFGFGDGAMFRALNGNKERVNLDLRDGSVEDLRPDILIDSLSPRAARNLGLDSLRTPRLSITAFSGDSPHHEWVAYGTGIHAITGLGDADDGRFVEPEVSYPDPLAGFAAFATAVRMLGASDVVQHVGVSLESATLPLLRCSDDAGDGGRFDLDFPVLSGPGIPVPATPAPSL